MCRSPASRGQNDDMPPRSPREPFPICNNHPSAFGVAQTLGRCAECGGETNGAYVMCGWCAQERRVCVLDGDTATFGLDD